MEQEQTHDNQITLQLVNVEEMAKILGVPVSWLYRHTRLNAIPCVRIGKYVRFKPQDVVTFFEEQQRPDEVK